MNAKKFIIVLLAALLAVGMVYGQPKTSVTLVAEGLFMEDSVNDKVKVESWNSMYGRVANQGGFSPYLSMATGMGARDGGIIGYWGHVGLGVQGGKSMFWSVGVRANFVDIAFGVEGGLGGLIELDDGASLRLEGTADFIMPFVKKSFATKGDNDYVSIGAYPKVGFVFRNGLEVGATMSVFFENRVVNGETNTDFRVGPYIRYGKGELSTFVSWNRWNLKDGDPMAVPAIKLAFTL